MAYDRTDVEVEDRTLSVETIVLIAAFTVIAGLSLTSFLVALSYALILGRWLLAIGTLGGSFVVLYVYYSGLETIFLEAHAT